MQAFLDLTAQGQPVGVNLVDAEGDEVVDVALDLLDVADQEQHLEQFDVERLQTGIGFRLVNGALHRGIEEALDGRVKPPERHQHAHCCVCDLLGGGLEGVEDGAFPA